MPMAALQALTAPEIEEIHQTTLRLLVDPGIRVSDPPLHDLLIQAGCRGGAAAQWVRFPAGLVEELLGQGPRTFSVSGAGGGQAYEVGAGRTYAASGFFGTAMLEPGQGERSALTLGDVTRFVRVAEALENIDFQAVPGLPQDVDQARALGAALREMLAYSAKPLLVAPFDERDAALVLAMMEAVEPGKPLSFLDHHIQVGNSLLGTTPELIEAGIPDDAFKHIEGDDKKTCTALKKRNKKERDGQRDMLHLMGHEGSHPRAKVFLGPIRGKIEEKSRLMAKPKAHPNFYIHYDNWRTMFEEHFIRAMQLGWIDPFIGVETKPEYALKREEDKGFVYIRDFYGEIRAHKEKPEGTMADLALRILDRLDKKY